MGDGKVGRRAVKQETNRDGTEERRRELDVPMTSLCVAEDERKEALCRVRSERERVSQHTEGSSSQVANTGWEYGWRRASHSSQPKNGSRIEAGGTQQVGIGHGGGELEGGCGSRPGPIDWQ